MYNTTESLPTLGIRKIINKFCVLLSDEHTCLIQASKLSDKVEIYHLTVCILVNGEKCQNPTVT